MSVGIIDFHTHAFPDALAARAIRTLEEKADIEARLDGRVSSLVASMDKAGVDKSVLASIATKADQFEPILEWSESIASDRIVPFPSVHPADPDAPAKVRIIAGRGFKGVKLHPYYQEFRVDEERIHPIYEALTETGLCLLLHTGFDVAFERIRIADPVRVRRVVETFPELKLVTSHMGAWGDWERAREHLFGKPVYVDVSYAIQFMEKERARGLLQAHSPDYLLFGTDSPWDDQAEAVASLRSLEFGPDWKDRVFFRNAAGLLGLA